MELRPYDGPRSNLGIGLGSDDAVGPRREFARRFTKTIEKLNGNIPRDHQKKTIGLAARMLEVVGLAGGEAEIRKVEGNTFSEIPAGKPPVSDGWTAYTLEIGWLLAAEPPRTNG
ncbi:hypothetical protein BHE74_00006478 [Ensete ventricosum]|nr:hypothetical protein GW17_00029272 [Ensete ventricosum]RWW84893.1 hypothetical protein BHE74_00006478 [Ensete ventricosum]RZR84555.1 hypothetical protein BHM03_00011402 [Ensete ventricosum]